MKLLLLPCQRVRQKMRFRAIDKLLFFLALGPGTLFLSSCASPGAPRAPSLQLPESVQDLVALRSGDDVVLRFTAPSRTSDGLALRSTQLSARFCRELILHGACVPVTREELGFPPSENPDSLRAGSGVVWRDRLPLSLHTGGVRAIRYRVEVRNAEGHSAGFSDPVVVAAGAAPPPVTEFSANGMRQGVLLGWKPLAGAGEILLERQQMSATTSSSPLAEEPHAQAKFSVTRSSTSGFVPGKRAKDRQVPTTLWLEADPNNADAAQTIDGSIAEGVRYRYTAERRVQVLQDGRHLELRSAPSLPVEIAWSDIYPLASPTAFAAVGFERPATSAQQASTFAVDLIWEPVSDPELAGYLVSRTALASNGQASGASEQLTPTPLPSPGFHDTTASPNSSYRYEVIAVDARGNRSPAASTEVRAKHSGD